MRHNVDHAAGEQHDHAEGHPARSRAARAQQWHHHRADQRADVVDAHVEAGLLAGNVELFLQRRDDHIVSTVHQYVVYESGQTEEDDYEMMRYSDTERHILFVV